MSMVVAALRSVFTMIYGNNGYINKAIINSAVVTGHLKWHELWFH